MIDKFGKAFLTMFGVGYFKYAPGTAASFVTCLIYYFLWIAEFSLHNNKIYIVIILLILTLYSIVVIDKLSKYFKNKDAKEIVVDEFIGQSIPLISFLFRPENFSELGGRFNNSIIIYIFLSFILFRIFDIFKPYPIYLIDKKIKNGVGVVLDDIVAGIFATIILYIIYSLWF